MINKIIKIEELIKQSIIKLEKLPFTAYLEILDNQIHVSLWRTFEQNDGMMNNSIVFIDLYEISQSGLNNAMSKIWEVAKN